MCPSETDLELDSPLGRLGAAIGNALFADAGLKCPDGLEWVNQQYDFDGKIACDCQPADDPCFESDGCVAYPDCANLTPSDTVVFEYSPEGSDIATVEPELVVLRDCKFDCQYPDKIAQYGSIKQCIEAMCKTESKKTMKIPSIVKSIFAKLG